MTTRLIALICAGLAALPLTACGNDEASGGEPAASGPAERIVTHAMGKTRVPGQPERVVVLDTGELDSAIALGVRPVGAVEAIAGAGFPEYLASEVEGITKVGTIEQPNLEAIAVLQPDLILSSKLRHEAIYDQLSRIAPTVFTEEVGVSWKENFRLHAEALGKETEARELEAEYGEQVGQLREALDGRLDGTAVSVVRSVGDEVRIYQKANFLGTILEDVGFPRPKPQDHQEFSATATAERIPDLDGDVMFLSRYGDDHRLLNRLMDSRQWPRLDVVQSDRVFEVPDDLWFLGIGNLAARQVVDDLHQLLVEGERLPGDDGNPATA